MGRADVFFAPLAGPEVVEGRLSPLKAIFTLHRLESEKSENGGSFSCAFRSCTKFGGVLRDPRWGR